MLTTFPRTTSPSTDEGQTSTFGLDGRLAVRPLKSRVPKHGAVDGGWRPNSDDLYYELPGLVTALNSRVGPIERILYRLDEWQPTPRRLSLGPSSVHVDGYHWQPPHTLIVRTRAGARLVLLVVPPHIGDTEAHDILATTAQSLDTETVGQLLGLVLTDVAPITNPAVAQQRWESDGGTAPRDESPTRR